MIVENESQVVEAVREAARSFEIVAGGTRRGVGRPAAGDEVLDVSRLCGIVSHEPEELILTVRPGTPLAEIDALLSAKGQRLGFEPADWPAMLGTAGTATIGGAVSCDASGPAALRFGRARDHLLGIRAVNGFGEAFKAGGKVVKNVTGFDIPKLFCGAMGTLGVLTELTFRVFPKDTRAACFAVCGIDVASAYELLRRVWSSPIDATALRYAPDGATHGSALIRFEGALEEKTAMLRAFAAPRELLAGDGIAPLPDDGRDLWRVSLPPANAAPFGPHLLGDWAGALLWASGEDVRERAERLGGTATLIRGPAETRARIAPFAPEAPARAALTRAVKAAFDPRALFNPGRMFEGV